MKKIPTLFVRDFENRGAITDEVTPGCEWVINGEGVATEKFDGMACLIRDGKLYRRYDAKHGKTPPSDFEPAQPNPDPVTGHWPGWVPVGDDPDDQYYREAWQYRIEYQVPFFGGEESEDWEWTYELIGPRVQGNPHGAQGHELIRHGNWQYAEMPRTFDGIRAWFEEHEMEGIVFWRDYSDLNCDKVKIKRRDFGLPWPIKRGK